jgi:hypothetical protein
MRTITGLLYLIAGMILLMLAGGTGPWGWLLAIAGAISLHTMVDHEVKAALKEDKQ